MSPESEPSITEGPRVPRRPADSIVDALAAEAAAALVAGWELPVGWVQAVAEEVAAGIATQDSARQLAARARLGHLLVQHAAARDAHPTMESGWAEALHALWSVADAAVSLDSSRHVRLEPGKLPAKLLLLVSKHTTVANETVLTELGLSGDRHGASKLSRAARGLINDALLVRRALGRVVLWEATARGKQVAEALEGADLAAAPRMLRAQP